MIPRKIQEKASSFAHACDNYLRVRVDRASEHTFMPSFVRRMLGAIEDRNPNNTSLCVCVLPLCKQHDYSGADRGESGLRFADCTDDTKLGVAVAMTVENSATLLQSPVLLGAVGMNADILFVHHRQGVPISAEDHAVVEAIASSSGLCYLVADEPPGPGANASRLMDAFAAVEAEGIKTVIRHGPEFARSSEESWRAILAQLTPDKRQLVFLNSLLCKSRSLLDAFERESEEIRRRTLAEAAAATRASNANAKASRAIREKEIESLRARRAAIASRLELTLGIFDGAIDPWSHFRADRIADEGEFASLLGEFSFRHDALLKEKTHELMRSSVAAQLDPVNRVTPARAPQQHSRYDSFAARFERQTIVLDVSNPEIWGVFREHLSEFLGLLDRSGERMRMQLNKSLSARAVPLEEADNATLAADLNSVSRKLAGSVRNRALSSLESRVKKELALPSMWEGFRWAKGVVGQLSVFLFIFLSLLLSLSTTPAERTFGNVLSRLLLALVVPLVLMLIFYPKQTRRKQSRDIAEYLEANLEKVIPTVRKVRADCAHEFAEGTAQALTRVRAILERRSRTELAQCDEQLRALEQEAPGRLDGANGLDDSAQFGRVGQQRSPELARALEAATLECTTVMRAATWL